MSTVTIDLRIPGPWRHPEELIERLPEGHRLTPEALILPDGTQIDFGAARADNQFAAIFHSSCRQPPTDEERAIVDDYQVNVFLSGPGGSLGSARTMMQAASAIVRAGGAGVFIDNSGLAHGGQNWIAMTEDGGPDAVSFAYVAIIQGAKEVYTMGMHALGQRDVLMKREDADADDMSIIELIQYLAAGESAIENGHLLGDLNGPRFQAFTCESEPEFAGSPMHNPFGRLKLVSVRDIGEKN